MPEDYKYTAADFERYHSGKMSEREMHNLEKAALADAFLYDALEGYAYTKTPQKDIEELKERLSAKRKKKNVFLIFSKENRWLRIAALFIVIAGIGYMAYQLNFNKENNTLAKNENKIDHRVPEQSVLSKPDSVANEETITFSRPENNNGTLPDKPGEIPNAAPAKKPNTIKISSDDLRQESMQTTVVSDAKRDEIVMNREKNILQGKVVDSLGNPIQYATIKDKNTNFITLSDSAGRFKFESNDTLVTATVSIPGYKTKEKQLSENNAPIIVMEHDSRSLNEVVVTANGLKKQRKEVSTSTQLKGKIPGIIISDSVSAPATAWQTFDEYIKNNINIPADEQGKSYKGKVVLSFEINKSGNPKKIKVEQSLCAACDEEAIRLLKNGPKWKYVNDKRQVITIQF